MSTVVADLSTFPIQPEALKLVPELIARKYDVIPLAISDNSLLVAMTEIDNILALEALVAQTRMRIKTVRAPVDEIRAAIDRNYKAYGEIEKQFSPNLSPELQKKERTTVADVSGAPVVRALQLIIEEAIKKRVSDIHIEPHEDKLRVRYRIDGVLHDTMSLPISAHTPLISRLKIVAKMNIAEHGPQDGQFSAMVREREVDIRVATTETIYGEMAVLRILDKSTVDLDLSRLGFLPNSLARYEKMLKASFGMILVCGPTGSGKTTSLYASINSLDCTTRKIITIEDPIEYRFSDINQIQVNARAGITFANGLRNVMRLDPDVILVGEIRDSETAEIAIQAALTGHLVLSSVHANDAVSAIYRLLDLGVERYLISAAVIGVVSQRILRRVCPHCAHPTPAPLASQLAYFNELNEMQMEFLYGSGCNACSNTGYLGRTAVFEMLTMNQEIKNVLFNGGSQSELFTKAVDGGMVSMWHDGMLKVKEGMTTPCEVLRTTFSI
ncbi:GspE/PulE family protein [Chloroflexota bacterium]